MNIDIGLFCSQSYDIAKLTDLFKKRDRDSREVEKLTKKLGLGTPEWQAAMIRRVREKVRKKRKLTELDYTFIHLQILQNIWVEDQLRAMGVTHPCMN